MPQSTNDQLVEIIKSDDDTDNMESEDEFSKIFESIKSDKEKEKDTNEKIFQIISSVSNDKQKILTTPGEWGSHLIKIEITNTRDLKGVSRDDYWKKISQNVILLIKSSKDNNYKKITKILQCVGKNVAPTNCVKKITRKYRNRAF